MLLNNEQWINQYRDEISHKGKQMIINQLFCSNFNEKPVEDR
jgi:hypothetical protein